MLSESVVQYTLTLNTEQFDSDFKRLEINTVRLMRYVTRLTGSPSLTRAVNIMTKAITTANTLKLALDALTVASATNPFGLFVAGMGFLVSTLAVADITTDIVGAG